jgi:hypothetical protein
MTRHRCRLLLDGSVPADFEGLGVLHVENVLAEWRIHELGVAVGEREEKAGAMGVVPNGHGVPIRRAAFHSISHGGGANDRMARKGGGNGRG